MLTSTQIDLTILFVISVKSRSTTDATEPWVKIVFQVFEDKAFDCVEHAALINKLEFYELRNESLGILRSYLNTCS